MTSFHFLFQAEMEELFSSYGIIKVRARWKIFPLFGLYIINWEEIIFPDNPPWNVTFFSAIYSMKKKKSANNTSEDSLYPSKS